MEEEPSTSHESDEGPEKPPPFTPDLDLIGYLEKGAKPDPRKHFKLPETEPERKK